MTESARKRGRPPKAADDLRVSRSIRLPQATWDRLDALARQRHHGSAARAVEAMLDADLDAWLARADAVNWSDYADLVLCERMVAAALRDLDPPPELEQFVEQALDTRLAKWAEGRG